jgi:hypothetical protein
VSFEQIDLFGESQHEKEYTDFVEKFKPKLTTDDCYTPAPIYEVIAEWVAKEYGVDRSRFLRPFYPGGDYQRESYNEGDVVVDNPPFSILSEIIRWYADRGIRYFLFCPALTSLGRAAYETGATVIQAGCAITYENGAEVRTAYVTNLDDPEIVIRTAPDLRKAVDEENEKIQKAMKRSVPKYEYPDEIVTAAIIDRWCKYGVDYAVRRSECVRVTALDMQGDKAIYGGGLLLSERAAAERAAAERAAAERAAATKWQLSEREKAIVAKLSGKKTEEIIIA